MSPRRVRAGDGGRHRPARFGSTSVRPARAEPWSSARTCSCSGSCRSRSPPTYLAPRRARNLVVTITSCVFYGWWNPIYLLLLLATTVIDYWAGLVQTTERWWPFGVEPRQLELAGPRSRIQRMALLLSIVSNLGLLAFFKYWNFGVSSWNTVATRQASAWPASTA